MIGVKILSIYLKQIRGGNKPGRAGHYLNRSDPVEKTKAEV